MLYSCLHFNFATSLLIRKERQLTFLAVSNFFFSLGDSKYTQHKVK